MRFRWDAIKSAIGLGSLSNTPFFPLRGGVPQKIWDGATVQSGFLLTRNSWECVRRERGETLSWSHEVNAKLCQVSSISSGQSAIRFLFTLNSWERVRREKKNMAHGGRGLWSQSGHTGNLFPKVLISKKRVTFTRRSIAAEDTNIHDPIWWP